MAIVTTDDKHYHDIADAIRNKTDVGALKPEVMGAAIEAISSGGEPIVGATNMSYMFQSSAATTLDLRLLDTSNVTTMSYMFSGSAATVLDLSSFDTSNVTDMSYMFVNSKAPILDLSSFDTSKVTNMTRMFTGSQATECYARTQADANKFNASSDKPWYLRIVVKP